MFHPTSILPPADCKCREEKTRQPSTIIDNCKTYSGDEWATSALLQKGIREPCSLVKRSQLDNRLQRVVHGNGRARVITWSIISLEVV